MICLWFVARQKAYLIPPLRSKLVPELPSTFPSISPILAISSTLIKTEHFPSSLTSLTPLSHL